MAETVNLGPFRIRPRGAYDGTEYYRYLDLVSYEGGSYICMNYDTIDKISCQGIPPVGAHESEAYWQCVAERGERGLIEVEHLEMGDLNDLDLLTGYIWDFDVTDKIYIDDAFDKELEIQNVYNGCIGAIITPNRNLKLPYNSDYSIDFNYMNIVSDNQYYLYTFMYTTAEGVGAAGGRFIWNRTVINKGTMA